ESRFSTCRYGKQIVIDLFFFILSFLLFSILAKKCIMILTADTKNNGLNKTNKKTKKVLAHFLGPAKAVVKDKD
ncbi:hypothetical protein, partial [Streptomyces mirabilis]|uniref:hypothetical protein n=1 Tax=Streptomyces mirabilis TaxID=68239 RepID=UPI0036A9C225